MSTHSGGNPRFRGPGMLWKTGWRRKKLSRDRFDMPFFVPFIAGVGPGQYYQSTEGADTFQGNANPGFTVGAALMLPPGYAAAKHSLMGRFATGGGLSEGWRIDILADNTVSLSIGTGAPIVAVAGPAAVVGAVYVFFVDVFKDVTGNMTLRFYVPTAGGVASLFATQASAAPYVVPDQFDTLYTFGIGSLTDPGAGTIRLPGMVMDESVAITGTSIDVATTFFQRVKNELLIPLGAGKLSDRIAAAVTYPVAPATYTTDLNKTLNQLGAGNPMTDTKFYPNFPY